MKIKLLYTVAIFSALMSCTTEPVDDTNNGDVINNDYLPLTTSNYWTYDVESDLASERDSLYVGNDTVINNTTYKKIQTLNLPFGSFSNSLNNNGLRKLGDNTLLSGTAGVNLGAVFPIDLSLIDFVILKDNATTNELLSAINGSITQDFQGYPLNIEYSLKTTALENLPSFTSPEGTVYTDIKKVKTALNLKISTTVLLAGFPISINIMNPQDVVLSIQYYSNHIGLVYNHTTISYELIDLSQYGLTLPIPQSDSQTQEEFLDTYDVN